MLGVKGLFVGHYSTLDFNFCRAQSAIEQTIPTSGMHKCTVMELPHSFHMLCKSCLLVVCAICASILWLPGDVAIAGDLVGVGVGPLPVFVLVVAPTLLAMEVTAPVIVELVAVVPGHNIG